MLAVERVARRAMGDDDGGEVLVNGPARACRDADAVAIGERRHPGRDRIGGSGERLAAVRSAPGGEKGPSSRIGLSCSFGAGDRHVRLGAGDEVSRQRGFGNRNEVSGRFDQLSHVL